MKKFIIVFLLAIMLFPSFVVASTPSCGGTISATATSSETKLCAKHLALINDGPDEVYIRLNRTGESATTSDFYLAADEFFVLDSDQEFKDIQAVCDTAETASVRYVNWK